MRRALARRLSSTTVFLTALASGCGGDDANTGAVSGRDGGGSDGDAAGAGSVSTDAAPAQWPDSGLGPPGTSIECAGNPCEGAGGLEPCCTDAGECGARYLGGAGAGCVALDGDGHIDPACPSSGETAGCCRPNGFCGAFYTATFGCVDPQVFPDPPQEEIPCTYAR